ncbi:uncharacterized protein B0I36DRAFT_326230 [Microdochium trichocladiopsis]|uniref:F-box domain-containing protein n=1 Tax=Microdochium trichocladiopsis TaxID=1682393 RepID=A0A9P8Y5E1_9PEZI|nr:uncharacterized protein B0I36DRAFT_326230 [Microdochium trichocladiopsis]KAH7029689.1 hypothetical protein B0I36DRAFT_326230 [Microdochium trichocladiopsis]
MPKTIDTLPTELHSEIISYLDIQSLAAFTGTSKHFHDFRPFFYKVRWRAVVIRFDSTDGTLLGGHDLQAILSCEGLRPYVHVLDIMDVRKPRARPDEKPAAKPGKSPTTQSIRLDLQRTLDQLSAGHCWNIAKHILDVHSKGEGIDAILWYIRIILALLRSVESITITSSVFARLNLPILRPRRVELAQNPHSEATEGLDIRSNAEWQPKTTCDHSGNCTVALPALHTIRVHGMQGTILSEESKAAAREMLRSQPSLDVLSFRNMDLSGADLAGMLPQRLMNIHLSHVPIKEDNLASILTSCPSLVDVWLGDIFTIENSQIAQVLRNHGKTIKRLRWETRPDCGILTFQNAWKCWQNIGSLQDLKVVELSIPSTWLSFELARGRSIESSLPRSLQRIRIWEGCQYHAQRDGHPNHEYDADMFIQLCGKTDAPRHPQICALQLWDACAYSGIESSQDYQNLPTIPCTPGWTTICRPGTIERNKTGATILYGGWLGDEFDAEISCLNLACSPTIRAGHQS